MRRAASLLDSDDLVINPLVVPGEERSAVDDHVDLVRTGVHRLLRLGDLDRREALARGKRRRHRGDADRAAAQRLHAVGDAQGVDADSGDRRYGRVARLGPHGFGAHRGHLPGRVRSFEGGQIHAADGEVERPQLGGLLDRALGQGRGPLVGSHLVHAPDAAHERTEVCEREGGRHVGIMRRRKRKAGAPPAFYQLTLQCGDGPGHRGPPYLFQPSS